MPAQLWLHLAAYKVPEYAQFVDAVPTTTSDKIARSKVRRLYGGGAAGERGSKHRAPSCPGVPF
ncbi:hypothetical protein [Saccharopolyspora hattusasensis]|uniref:hypothetical protein n=1 Tax=Saccharopolyspora hattusasensis TaxID=1128679 RepID=UPI003D963AC7